MTDIFEGINKQISENESRWREIDRITEKLKNYSVVDKKTLVLTIDLVLLLVEHLRPMSSAKEQTENLQKEISEMINIISGGK